MFNSILSWAIGVLFPKAPKWVGALLTVAIPALVELVEKLQASEVSGSDKFDFVVKEVGAVLDEAFDGIPEWTLYPEEGRDRIIGGLTELAVFVNTVVKSHGKKKASKVVTKALKAIRKIEPPKK